MDRSTLQMIREKKPATVCVTGATGYIGSWLIRSLLRRGYQVHATVRYAGKASWVESSFGGNGGLRMFEADLNKKGSFDAAVKGCQFVFHVAASMEFHAPAKENVELEDHVRKEILEPAVEGTINVLQACAGAGTIKRVVFTSSISTISGRDGHGQWRLSIDESSTLPINRVWKAKPDGWVYVLSKLLTERKAFEFAQENGIDLVSIIPPTVAGPFLTPTVPASVQVLISPITGDSRLHPILASVHCRLGSVPLVHIEDICNAHIFLMEHSGARGRYMCSVGSCQMLQLTHLLALNYPTFTSNRWGESQDASNNPAISSKRLTDLGFDFKYGVEDIVQQSVACCVDRGFLNC